MFATDGAFEAADFCAGVVDLGFMRDIPPNRHKTGRFKHRGFVPGRWVVERTHAHPGAFRGIHTRCCGQLRSYEAFLTAAAYRTVAQAGL